MCSVPGMILQHHNSSTKEDEAGEFWVWGHLGLYMVRLFSSSGPELRNSLAFKVTKPGFFSTLFVYLQNYWILRSLNSSMSCVNLNMYWLELGSHCKAKAVLNTWARCLSPQSARVTWMCYHTQLRREEPMQTAYTRTHRWISMKDLIPSTLAKEKGSDESRVARCSR